MPGDIFRLPVFLLAGAAAVFFVVFVLAAAVREGDLAVRVPALLDAPLREAPERAGAFFRLSFAMGIPLSQPVRAGDWAEPVLWLRDD